MARFLLYEGVSEDPLQQTVRLVEGDSIDEVWEREKGRALCIQQFIEDPRRQEPLNVERLKRPTLVWSA